MAEQKPSIGRTVIYRHPADEDGKPAVVDWSKAESPATIVQLESGYNKDSELLAIFSVVHLDTIYRIVKQGDEPNTWHWPVRIESE